MKKILFLTASIVLFFCLSAWIQAHQEIINTGFSTGLQLNHHQQDLGAGLSLTSPYFTNAKMAVRIRGNIMFHEHIDGGESTWSVYPSVTAGLIGVAGSIQDFIRLYGEGGVTGLFPSSAFSDDDFVFGGYGLFGFEFYMKENNNYFIEIGGIGTGARSSADSAPFYSNGLLISTGLRMHF